MKTYRGYIMIISKPILSVVMILLIIGVIPSLVLADDNSYHAGFNVGSFSDIKGRVLNMINSEIARLQGASANVSYATNMSELQKAMGRDRMSPKSHGMNLRGMNLNSNGSALSVNDGFDLKAIENVNDTTFSTVQADTVASLQNMTARLQNQENRSLANNNTVMGTQIADKITAIQGLTTNISQATDVEGMQNAALTFMQSQFDYAINYRIATIQQMENNGNCTTMNITKLNNNIANLKTLKTNIDNTKSLSDLSTVMSSSHIMTTLGSHQMVNQQMKGYRMHNGGYRVNRGYGGFRRYGRY
jgi:hypothetical protein